MLQFEHGSTGNGGRGWQYMLLWPSDCSRCILWPKPFSTPDTPRLLALSLRFSHVLPLPCLLFSQGGFFEAWSFAAGRKASSIGSVRSLPAVKVEGDCVCRVACMPHDPFLVLGCSSGSLRFAMLAPGEGESASLQGELEARQVKGFKLLPHHGARFHIIAGRIYTFLNMLGGR